MPKDFPQGGVAYEPRSFWSARTFSTVDIAEGRPTLEFRFNREHFRNGTRWPVELRRIAICPINYPFVDGYDTAAFGPDAGMGVINKMTVRIGVPFRQQYMRQDFRLSSLCPRPSAEPEMPATSRSASLWGVCRMQIDEDRPLILPRTATVETAFTGITRFQDPRSPEDPPFPSASSFPATIAWLERGGLLVGDARSKRLNFPVAQINANALGGNGANDESNDDLPYGYPGLFTSPLYVTGTSGFWQAAAQISGRDWDQQEATRAGSTRVDSGVIGFDQWAYDTDCAALVAAGRFSHIATRIGSRIKIFNAGSGADWWRPGAPVALTFDHITPANVYELPQPIVLTPGDSLDVTVTIPAAEYGAQWSVPVPPPTSLDFNNYADRYQFGISFNGYAAIES